jgi:hypothetical protein
VDSVLGLSRFMMYGIKVGVSVSNRTRLIDQHLVKEIGIVVSNLCACVRNGRALRYSRDTKHSGVSRYNKKGISTKKIIKAIDVLEREGYVLNTIASKNQDPRFKRVNSSLLPTQKFIDVFCADNSSLLFAEESYYDAEEVVILRDSDKNDIDYKDCEKSNNARDVVVKLNNQSRCHLFADYAGECFENKYVRIFNRGDMTFNSGGRFYRSDIQNMPNNDNQRLHMSINGDSVVEVDFSNLHIRLLADLHCVSTELYKIEDLYLLPFCGDLPSYDDRWIIKHAVNIMLNSTSERSATQAINMVIRSNLNKTFLYNKGRDIVELVKNSYKWLKDDFCQKESRGHYLMNIDSMIASHVVEDFINTQQAICIIHDSFVVQSKNRDKLVSAMAHSYVKVVESERTNKYPRHEHSQDISVHMKVKWIDKSNETGNRLCEESIIAK